MISRRSCEAVWWLQKEQIDNEDFGPESTKCCSVQSAYWTRQCHCFCQMHNAALGVERTWYTQSANLCKVKGMMLATEIVLVLDPIVITSSSYSSATFNCEHPATAAGTKIMKIQHHSHSSQATMATLRLLTTQIFMQVSGNKNDRWCVMHTPRNAPNPEQAIKTESSS